MQKQLLSLSLLLFSTTAVAMPIVSGNTISWPDDGWYQVQRSDTYEQVCGGGLSCEVDPGTYIVINHTSGERFTDVQVSSAEPAITVSGNTISWLDDGWYQVQRSDTYEQVCGGGLSCEVDPGTYIVINHTSGERFTDVQVGSAEPAITVTGNTISWPDDGWYQVQTADTYISLCNGGRSCDVPDGIYIVINHTTGERFEGIPVPDNYEEPGPQLPTDCLLASDGHGTNYCYTRATRELMAVSAGGDALWRFSLPGDSTLNEISHLHVIGDRLILVAGLDPLSSYSTFEISAFDLGGEFQYTVPILEEISDVYAINADNTPLRIAVHEDRLLIAGEHYSLASTGSWARLGSFVASVGIDSGNTLVSRTFPGLSLGSSISITDDTLVLSLNGTELLLNAMTLADINDSIDYPRSATVTFNSHSTGDILTLPDGSIWQITGASNSSHAYGSNDVVIYEASSSTPDPLYGSRSDYYLVGDDILPAFFIRPVHMTESRSATVTFNSHSTGDILTLPDGSIWQITGASNSSHAYGSNDVVIYEASSSTPDPLYGSRSDYYLVGDDMLPAFFIRPIFMAP